FDANAKRVEISYLNLKNNDDKEVEIFSDRTSRIIVKDDGVGMDLYDIENKWLNIAYSEKKINSKQHNRLMAGAKGVGRFSCDRLGEYLNLYSKVAETNKYILLSIDWKKFEVNDDKKEIQSVKLNYEILSEIEFESRGFKSFDHGVLLEIIKLRSVWVYEIKNSFGKTINWNTDKFSNLKKYLEKLINPNQAFEKNDFGIYFNAPEFIIENNNLQNHNKFIGKIENTIFDKLDFQCTSIESSIINDGEVIFTELKDKGQTIFWIKEKNDYFPLIKNAKIVLYYLNPYAKAFFTKQTGIRSVDYGSIFLFINGFRVSPYGEVGNDWLGIDQRKAQGFARFIGLREFVGRIEILDYNNDFQIISSREGVVKNENYISLVNQEGNKSYFFRTLRKLEKYVVDGLSWDSIPEKDRDRISEIEKKIISGEIKESELNFRENNSIKDRRIYESIHSIISAKAENVIELYINENLIFRKIGEERENSEKEFNQLLVDFENKKIDADILNRILQKKAEQNKDIDKQLFEFSKYNTNEVTAKAILELQNYKETIVSQSNLINELVAKIQLLENAGVNKDNNIDFLKSKIDQIEQKAQVFQQKYEIEKRKTVYLQLKENDDLSDDADILVHDIKDRASEINAAVNKAMAFRDINSLYGGELHECLRRIDEQNKKIYHKVKLMLHSNLREDKIFVNIPDYFEDYLQINNIFDNPIHTA
ncbi:MAG TPA: ATP-binding protein, partial [Paludibacter sp.]|nr:ATP-binding protein [Paludibacter sp.]